MSLSSPFIQRPVATTLLTIAVALGGAVAYKLLPVSPLPQVDFPTISVSAGLPGASPEIMASSVATPLERQFGRIAAVTEMTSSSVLGQTSVTLQFDLSRDINAAARDVQAAINAARGYLPTNLPGNPTYRKVNPADAPIMILGLTSNKLPPGKLYDAASTVLAQKLSQIQGVGQVVVGGSSLPGVRIDLNPNQLNSFGLQLDDVRTAVAAQTVNQPKGSFNAATRSWQIHTNDQLLQAIDYQPLIVAYRNGAPVTLSNIANVQDSVEDLRSVGLANGQRAALLIVFRQPGVNIIETVDRIKSQFSQMKASINQTIDLTVLMDQTVTIRASVNDVERTLLISIGLVVLVVFVFLRDPRATLIPSVAVPVSLIGTFGAMYLFGYSIDNLSLMALTISTGFVVDDAIVVIENITRYREKGMNAMQASLKGASEIGFTVLSISVSLIAVFIPILMMGGIIGRLFREFAVVLSVTILVSLVVSLTTTPMMCSRLLKDHREHGRLYLASERLFNGMLKAYEVSLGWTLRNSALMLVVFIITFCLNIYLFMKIPKGFFPQQDTGRMNGSILGAQDSSFQAMQQRVLRLCDIVKKDPGVASVAAFTGGGGGTTVNTGRVFISLKPLAARKVNADQIINRLRPQLARVPGATLYLQSVQDLRVGGRQSGAQYQYTIQSGDLSVLTYWAPQLLKALKQIPSLTDVNSDQQNNGLAANLAIDRETASRLGISPANIDSTLYSAFGQRQIATMYTALNQYHVVMEVDPNYWQSPEGLKSIYIKSATGGQVPLAAVTHYQPSVAPLTVNHQGQYPSVTVSFNLAPGVALGDAVNIINDTELKLGMPATIQGSFSGTAQAFQASLQNEPYLIAAAIGAVYIVLGILYESFVHPITILSSLPSAGVGAVLALNLFHFDLSVIAVIGVILLIGIVKKNAIMMIDFALEVERRDHKSSKDAAFEACLLRFRPILMTTMAAMLGGLPLALGTGTGSELRRPLGITIVGGLLVSQLLTLYTTPVIYVYMDRLSLWLNKLRGRSKAAISPRPSALGPAT
ncbi:MAG: multidrug efflux RND transporter permease subunit [Bryobacteraceae bacterium]